LMQPILALSLGSIVLGAFRLRKLLNA
jgi:hypothetical protein